MQLDYKALEEEVRERGRWYTLDNGITILAENNPGLGLAQGDISIAPGSATETEEDYGVVHFLEHMVLQGSERYPYVREENMLAGVLGMFINAQTSSSSIYFPIKGSNNSNYILEDNFPKAFDMVYDLVYNPRFRVENLEKERIRIQRERVERIAEQQNLFQPILNQIDQRLYSNNKDLLRDPIGIEKTIDNITSEKLRRYHKRLFRGKNTTVLLSGDLRGPNGIEQFVEKTLEDIEAGEKIEVQIQEETPYNGTEILHLDAPVEGFAQVTMYFQTGPMYQEDSVAKNTLSDILGAGQINLLLQNLTKKGIVYSAGAYTLGHDKSGFIKITYNLDPLRIEESIIAVNETIAQVKHGDFSDENIKSKKAAILPEILARFARPGWVLEDLDTRRKSKELGVERSWLEVVEKYFTITKKDIITAANKYLTEDRLLVIIS